MRVPYNEMKNEFNRVLIKKGFDLVTAETAATIIADNSCYGVFIAINPVVYAGKDYADTYIENMSEYIKTSSKMSEVSDILYPGERVVREREVNLKEGIPVSREIWEKVLKL
jgi:LDH2 family malate/lactate/ureidoglycolate dehydrogenase